MATLTLGQQTELEDLQERATRALRHIDKVLPRSIEEHRALVEHPLNTTSGEEFVEGFAGVVLALETLDKQVEQGLLEARQVRRALGL